MLANDVLTVYYLYYSRGYGVAPGPHPTGGADGDSFYILQDNTGAGNSNKYTMLQEYATKLLVLRRPPLASLISVC